ncbi:hypothetical protein [Methylobacterium terricola]|uniref:hypothetical protein n=1 Tax=Methylobacterium terricola TaxID=2583531 RepID=UPI00197CA14A|nr:hypothetical protein [Methylobacterium terricola]
MAVRAVAAAAVGLERMAVSGGLAALVVADPTVPVAVRVAVAALARLVASAAPVVPAARPADSVNARLSPADVIFASVHWCFGANR